MKGTKRISISRNRFARLIREVDGLCPLCGAELLSFVDTRGVCLSQAAHIYPHSPSEEELKLLQDVPRLSLDAENIDNLIMLCPNCHLKFDNPRTKEAYLQLFKLKEQILKRERARKFYEKHNIEEDLLGILECVGNIDIAQERPLLSYKVMTVEEKMAEDASVAIKNTVKRNVRDYYFSIRSCLEELEEERPGVSDLIAQEIKLFYSQLKTSGSSKDEIYYAIIDWLDIKTKRQYEMCTPIVTAYYIQSCEVFSIDNAK